MARNRTAIEVVTRRFMGGSSLPHRLSCCPRPGPEIETMLRPTSLSRSLLVALLALPTCTPSPGQAPTVSVPAAPPASSAAAPAAAPAPSPPSAGGLRTDPFGGERWGFVEASSANGRLVVLRRFAGDAKPSFGQHGASSS